MSLWRLGEIFSKKAYDPLSAMQERTMIHFDCFDASFIHRGTREHDESGDVNQSVEEENGRSHKDFAAGSLDTARLVERNPCRVYPMSPERL